MSLICRDNEYLACLCLSLVANLPIYHAHFQICKTFGAVRLICIISGEGQPVYTVISASFIIKLLPCKINFTGYSIPFRSRCRSAKVLVLKKLSSDITSVRGRLIGMGTANVLPLRHHNDSNRPAAVCNLIIVQNQPHRPVISIYTLVFNNKAVFSHLGYLKDAFILISQGKRDDPLFRSRVACIFHHLQCILKMCISCSFVTAVVYPPFPSSHLFIGCQRDQAFRRSVFLELPHLITKELCFPEYYGICKIAVRSFLFICTPFIDCRV